jgi:hypothetical protein
MIVAPSHAETKLLRASVLRPTIGKPDKEDWRPSVLSMLGDGSPARLLVVLA